MYLIIIPPSATQREGGLFQFEAEKVAKERLAIEGDQGVEITAAAVKGFVGGKDKENEKHADDKARDPEEAYKDEKHDA